VLVEACRLVEAGALRRGLVVPTVEQAGLPKHAVHGRGAQCNHVGVDHHEGEASVAFEWVLVVIVDDRLALLRLDR
jgi:hypothetical protein